jgi:phosphoribosylformylglycinamidine synthase I
MKFGVITFPGSNCDHDLMYVIDTILEHEVVNIWHKDTSLQGVDFVFIPGGFSYGDYLRSGAIARFSPIMNEVIKHAKNGGYVMGICNGFQILTESGLLPGALLHNSNQNFICKNTFIKAKTHDSLITNSIPEGLALKIPIAHGEGRYFASDDTLKSLQDNDEIVFQYCDELGNITPESNPNGSILNIAGICNQQRNVFGMMPHPERAADINLNNQDGLLLFESILEKVSG